MFLVCIMSLTFSQNGIEWSPSTWRAIKEKVTGGNNIGRLITRFLKYTPELLDEVVDTKCLPKPSPLSDFKYEPAVHQSQEISRRKAN